MKDSLSKLRLIIKGFFFSSVFLMGVINYPSASHADIEGIRYNRDFPNAQYPYAQAPNGCGPTGIFGSSPTDVRDTWGSVNFTEACNRHDRCYYTLGSKWNTCNERFYSDLRSACERDVIKIPIIGIPEPTTLSACYTIATAYFAAVQGGVALNVFADAQKLQSSYQDWVAKERILHTIEDIGLPAAAPGWMVVGVGDFNGDGKADLVWRRHNNTDEARIWLLNSGQLVADIGLPAAAPGWMVVGVGDFNGDGKADLVWRRMGHTGEARIWLLNSGQLLENRGLPAPDSGWMVVGVGEFNGEGKADLVWRRLDNTGEARIWIVK